MKTIVIKGDIISSRSKSAQAWLPAFKKNLVKYFGKEQQDWAIYEGDSFIIKLQNSEDAVKNCLLIKSYLLSFHGLNARLALGLGEIDFEGSSIMEANGSAYSYAGDTLSRLKQEEQTIKFDSDREELNRTFNLILLWLTHAADQWNVKTARAFYYKLADENLTQAEIAVKMGIKSQSGVSEHLSRGGASLIFQTLFYFQTRIKELL